MSPVAGVSNGRFAVNRLGYMRLWEGTTSVVGGTGRGATDPVTVGDLTPNSFSCAGNVFVTDALGGLTFDTLCCGPILTGAGNPGVRGCGNNIVNGD